jgi:Tfp pilus assembly protein PilX
MKMSLQQRGIALIMALLTLLLLSAIGLSILFMVNTETGVNYNFRSSQQAYYGAKAGVEEGRTRLRGGRQ